MVRTFTPDEYINFWNTKNRLLTESLRDKADRIKVRLNKLRVQQYRSYSHPRSVKIDTLQKKLDGVYAKMNRIRRYLESPRAVRKHRNALRAIDRRNRYIMVSHISPPKSKRLE